MFRFRRQRYGVDNRRVAVFWKCADDFHARLSIRVGLVDDAKCGLAGRHQLQCRPNILGLCSLALDRGPHAERFECRLAILARWYSLDIAHRELAVAEKASEV